MKRPMAIIETQGPEETFRLREYVGVLWYRKWSILAITLAAVLVSVFYVNRQVPKFTSVSRVVATNPLAAIQNNPLAAPNLDTEKALVSSTTVAKCASLVARAHPAADPLSTDDVTEICTDKAMATEPVPQGLQTKVNITAPPNTNLLLTSVTDPKPHVAQALAQAFAEAYVWYRTTAAIDYIDGIREPLLAQQKSLNEQITKVNAQILSAISAGNTTLVPSLQTRLSGLNSQLQGVQTQLFQVSTSKIAPPTLASLANLPQKPSSPNKPLVAVAGLFVGVLLGIGLAFLRERLDDRLRGRADLESSLGVPVMAVIPQVPGWKKRQDTKLITIDQPRSATSEAYRSLRTGVLFAAAQRGMKVIMVASPSAGEGKTTTAANLAVALADTKKRVILVSADLRKPRLHRFFGLQNKAGVSQVITGEVNPWEALLNPEVENLRVMASGPPASRPAELLQTEQMGQLIADLREVADFVIIDTAPILLVADALALVPLVDGVLFVSDANTTSRGAVEHARQELEQVDAPLFGALLNNFDPTRARYYYGYYGYRGGYRYRYGGYRYGAAYGYTYDNGGRRRRSEPIEEQRPTH
jgi:tyrosine-protein kinase